MAAIGIPEINPEKPDAVNTGLWSELELPNLESRLNYCMCLQE